jgi:hypothetical protein
MAGRRVSSDRKETHWGQAEAEADEWKRQPTEALANANATELEIDVVASAGAGHCNPPVSVGLAKRQKVQGFFDRFSSPLNGAG